MPTLCNGGVWVFLKSKIEHMTSIPQFIMSRTFNIGTLPMMNDQYQSDQLTKSNQVLIAEFHQYRFDQYCKKRKMKPEDMVHHLSSMHKQGMNIAKHVSDVIGMDHDDYIKQLELLHENPLFIR